MLISHATSPSDIAEVRRLFSEYAAELNVDLCFQGFAEELETLPGSYAAPDGALLLARVGEQPVGCAALRRFSADTGEIKRLFVRRPFRGEGIGKQLTEEIISAARRAGYQHLVLDTLASLKSAISLYEQQGFRVVTPYYNNPLPDVVYFRLDLRSKPL